MQTVVSEHYHVISHRYIESGVDSNESKTRDVRARLTITQTERIQTQIATVLTRSAVYFFVLFCFVLNRVCLQSLQNRIILCALQK